MLNNDGTNQLSPARQRAVDALLVLVTFFWGTTFAVVKEALTNLDVMAFLAIRFTAAFFLMVIIFYRRLLNQSLSHILYGACLGLFLFGAFVSQTWGLLFTSASNAGFITGINVVWVPILSLFVLRRPPDTLSSIAVIVAAVGLYILIHPSEGRFNLGDVMVFICSLFLAFHIVLTGHLAPRFDPMALATWQIGTVALLCTSLSLTSGSFTFHLSASLWGAIALTAIFATVLAFPVQTLAQQFTPPTRTALIFTAEPVFAALFAHFYSAEPLLWRHLFGGGLILLGMILSELRPSSWNGTQGG